MTAKGKRSVVAQGRAAVSFKNPVHTEQPSTEIQPRCFVAIAEQTVMSNPTKSVRQDVLHKLLRRENTPTVPMNGHVIEPRC